MTAQKIVTSVPCKRIALRRGLNREEAAEYIGVGPTKFDQLVGDGRMPIAKRIDGRKVWDVWALDAAFDALDAAGEVAQNKNPWDRDRNI